MSARNEQVRRQKRRARVWRTLGLVRAVIWAGFIVLVLAHVPFAEHAASTVLFVSIVSLYANAATDFGQAAASDAAVAAAEARADIESLSQRILATAEAIEERQIQDGGG